MNFIVQGAIKSLKSCVAALLKRYVALTVGKNRQECFPLSEPAELPVEVFLPRLAAVGDR
ncbi:MAG: hypothetical protein AVO34_00390 [Firmicutes bacterium ML8_F2]|nr:MAG: hypothetical protein AVO34_00390 [Firmicutes bacterium ML8_F2]